MKWSILVVTLAISGALSSLPGGKVVDWSKIRPREVWPGQLNKDLQRHQLQFAREYYDGRIVGGSEVTPGKYPYQVGLVIDLFYWCGGSLLSNLYVLTAAHCTDMSFEIDIYLGAHNIREAQEEGRRVETVQFGNIRTHEDYDGMWLKNDIALLMMNRRIEFTDRIQPIRLPTRTEGKWEMELKKVVASGWGRPADNAGSINDILKSADLQVQPPIYCRHFFKEVYRNENVCTSTGRGEGTCNGDSGGPLVYAGNSSDPFIIGLTSYGSSMGCVGVGWPSVFTRVSSYLNWIRDNTDIIIKD